MALRALGGGGGQGFRVSLTGNFLSLLEDAGGTILETRVARTVRAQEQEPNKTKPRDLVPAWN
jgi:hypothetical protein